MIMKDVGDGYCKADGGVRSASIFLKCTNSYCFTVRFIQANNCYQRQTNQIAVVGGPQKSDTL